MNPFTSWKDKATNYLDVRLGLIKLGLIDRASSVLGHLLISFIYIFLTFSTLTFIGYGLMETFSNMLDSRVGGAFMTAGLFAVLLIILFLVRKSIINAFAGIFIRVLTETDEDDDNEHDEDHRNVKVEG